MIEDIKDAIKEFWPIPIAIALAIPLILFTPLIESRWGLLLFVPVICPLTILILLFLFPISLLLTPITLTIAGIIVAIRND